MTQAARLKKQMGTDQAFAFGFIFSRKNAQERTRKIPMMLFSGSFSFARFAVPQLFANFPRFFAAENEPDSFRIHSSNSTR
jgi:hypothetical protein